MEGFLLILIMVVALALGIYLNKSFQEEFLVPAVQTVPCILQCVAMGFMLINFPDGNVTGWFIMGVVLVIVTYVVAFICCKKNAESEGAEGWTVIKAVVAQFLIPIGVVLLIFVIIAVLCSRNNKKKKR